MLYKLTTGDNMTTAIMLLQNGNYKQAYELLVKMRKEVEDERLQRPNN